MADTTPAAVRRIEDYTIADVLRTSEYYANISAVVDELSKLRDRPSNGKLKRHPIDRLRERGMFTAGQMTVLFAEVLNKSACGYSHAEREFIRQVGMEAFNTTMRQFIASQQPADKKAKKPRARKTGKAKNTSTDAVQQ